MNSTARRRSRLPVPIAWKSRSPYETAATAQALAGKRLRASAEGGGQAQSESQLQKPLSSRPSHLGWPDISASGRGCRSPLREPKGAAHRRPARIPQASQDLCYFFHQHGCRSGYSSPGQVAKRDFACTDPLSGGAWMARRIRRSFKATALQQHSVLDRRLPSF